jgi:hypothetical protein
MLSEAVRQATGSQLDLLAEPAARAPAFFGLRSEIVNGIYPSIADCTPGTQPDPNLLNYLCRRFATPRSDRGQEVPKAPQRSLYSAALYCFLPEELPVVPNSSAGEDSPFRSWFPDGGVLICRPAADRTEFAVALKGGHNAEHHNHNDVGTFMVVSGRAMVLCDPGAEIYTARTFSGRRYESDVLNSFGHPVPLVAGHLQQTGSQARGRVLRHEFTEASDTVVLDIRSAYPVATLKRLERAFTYRRQPKASLTVADSVEFEAPQTFETALLTWGTWQRVSPGELLITDETGAVRVKIETEGKPFEIKSKRLEADVHTPKHAERLGIALSSPVKSAVITLVVEPVTK